LAKRTLITEFAITYSVKYYIFEKERWIKQWEKEIRGRDSEPVKTALEPEAQRYSLVFTMGKPDGFTLKLEGSHKVETITEKAVSRDKSNRDIVVIFQAEPENAIELRSEEDEDEEEEEKEKEDIIVIPPEDEPV
jgi:hypothetical protein